MLNPDGVERGNYRMDMYGQNLNRYYNNCNQMKQPSIFALRSLMEYYARQNRLMFYFDLHAHPARKGCFVYGNALSDFTQQVQNYVFCKVMSLNTPYFEYQSCNFSQKHMKHKDRFEELTKEGCGRVFAYKCSGIIHSFTLELGYHFTNIMNNIPAASNQQFQWNGSAYRPLLNCAGDSAYLTPKAYENVGQSLLISVLDVLQKNPYSRVVTSEYCTLENLRRLTAFQVFHQDERFRMFEAHTYTKVKHINDLIEESLYSKVYKHFLMPPEVQWPSCVRTGKQPIIAKLKQSPEQSHSPSPKNSDKIQLPDIKPKPFNLKIRSCSVKKDEEDKPEDIDQDSVESSEQSESEVIKTEQKQIKNLDDIPIKASSASPSNKLKLLNLKFSMRSPPVLNMVPFSEGGLSESSNLNFTSNRQVKQVNLTFQQNFLVFPTVQKPPTSKNSSSFIYQNISSKGLLVDAFRTAEYQKRIFDQETRDNLRSQSLKITGQGREPIQTDLNDQQLKEQLLREMQYFKRQIKEQFSKDIKKEVTEQINKSTFARGYMKNKRQVQYSRQRKNKFFPNSDQEILAVSNFKQEDKSKIVRLPSIGK